MTKHTESTQASTAEQITLRSPAELADALPYLMGFHPDAGTVKPLCDSGGGTHGQ